MENPFEFGRELGADELVDREEEVAQVINTIRDKGKLFLIGPRRFGKTSILKAASDRASRDGILVLRYNAEAYPSLDELVSAIIADAAKGLRGGVERVGEQIKRLFTRLRPELSFNITQASWGVKLGTAVSTNEEPVGLLVDALGGLEKMAEEQEAERPVGLIIDEFQKVIETGGANAEGQIRAAIQQHSSVGYVFAGSKTRMLLDMTMNASRPFYRLGALRFIGPIPRPEFVEFLTSRFVQSGYRIEGTMGGQADSGPVALILDLAEEVPYNVQLLAHTCWEQLRGAAETERTLSPEAVRLALERVVRQYDPFYTQLWTQLTSIQQKTLRAVISEEGRNMQSMRVAGSVGKGPSTVKRAVESLINREILREEQKDGVVSVKFEDPFFSAWITFFARR